MLTRPGFSCQLLKLFFFPQFTVRSELVQTVVGSTVVGASNTQALHSTRAEKGMISKFLTTALLAVRLKDYKGVPC